MDKLHLAYLVHAEPRYQLSSQRSQCAVAAYTGTPCLRPLVRGDVVVLLVARIVRRKGQVWVRKQRMHLECYAKALPEMLAEYDAHKRAELESWYMYSWTHTLPEHRHGPGRPKRVLPEALAAKYTELQRQEKTIRAKIHRARANAELVAALRFDLDRVLQRKKALLTQRESIEPQLDFGVQASAATTQLE